MRGNSEAEPELNASLNNAVGGSPAPRWTASLRLLRLRKKSPFEASKTRMPAIKAGTGHSHRMYSLSGRVQA